MGESKEEKLEHLYSSLSLNFIPPFQIVLSSLFQVTRRDRERGTAQSITAPLNCSFLLTLFPTSSMRSLMSSIVLQEQPPRPPQAAFPTRSPVGFTHTIPHHFIKIIPDILHNYSGLLQSFSTFCLLTPPVTVLTLDSLKFPSQAPTK